MSNRSLLVATLLCTPPLWGQTTLTADGHTDTYKLITSVLGAGPEVPDCSHLDFGPHVTQVPDEELGKFVFEFHAHIKPDNDRCVSFDRQRVELKTDGSSPAALRAFAGDTMNFRWKFKLPAGYQASSRFTHIHQIKAGDGNDGAPLITYSTAAGDIFKITYYPDSGPVSTLTTTKLAPFVGAWVEANETVTFAAHGSIETTLTRVSDGKELLKYSNRDINLLRSRTTFYRPKIGIYRSILDAAALRDENVRFDQFCIAKAPKTCGGGNAPRLPAAELKAAEGARIGPDFSLILTPGARTVRVGDSTTFQASTHAAGGFHGRVSFSASGIPPGVTVSFDPPAIETGEGTTTVTMLMGPTALDRKVTVTITASSGSLVHGGAVTLSVQRAAPGARPETD